jgi:hypothetical protein
VRIGHGRYDGISWHKLLRKSVSKWVERYDLQMLTSKSKCNTCSALRMCVEYGGGGWKDTCAQCTLLRGASTERLVC